MDRQGFIGGTDAIRIMNGEWLELYQEKVGLTEPEDLSEVLAVQLGVHTERFNLDWWKQEHEPGFQLSEAKSHYQTKLSVSGNGVPLQGTTDMMVMTGQGTSFIVEAKHTNAFTNMASVIERYMPQIQFYMYISGLPQMFFSVISGNTHSAAVVDANADYQNDMLDKIKAFWEYVTHGQRPEDVLIKTKQVIKDNVAINGKVKRDVSRSNSFALASTEYLLHEENAKVFENAKKELKAELKDNESEIYNDKLSVKRDKRGSIRITKKG